VEFDPMAPYGPLTETTVRLATWNVFARYGDAEARQPLIDAQLSRLDPDIVCLTEAWALPDMTQAQHVADQLGHPSHAMFGAPPAADEWTSGIAITSRWPITESEHRALTDRDGRHRGLVAYASVGGPRGEFHVLGVMLDYPLGASDVRRHQVDQVLDLLAERAERGAVAIVCGDFNAAPDSDEIRMLTGRTPAPGGVAFYDAWEVAGDGGPGTTFARANPLAAISLFPDRRFDYIFSAWPRGGGRGHPVNAEVFGQDPGFAGPASDHYGVVADLRY
jgi:endonuclease/exonuclease/phosphatase family metal-dependent hydrolase